MNEKRAIRISKFLSKHLRHDPAGLGLTLAPGGWVAVDDLLAACGARGFPLDRTELDHVVAHSDKRRFAFDDTRARIRANQGHSVEVDLELEPVVPPEVLYHGTGHGAVASILATGLERRARHHVHLSADVETARRVGARHGRPVVFVVRAGVMNSDGFTFYRSSNGVWLVDSVPVEYLSEMDES